MDVHRGSFKPLQHCFSCVLQVVVLSVGESWTESEVLSALEQVSIHISVLSVFSSPSSLTSLSIPAAVYHAATTLLHFWDGIGHVMNCSGFSSDMMLRI